jgi:SNF2 family DNA or RNA helicase
MSIYDRFPLFTDMGDEDVVITKRKHHELSSEPEDFKIPEPGDTLNSFEESELSTQVEEFLSCQQDSLPPPSKIPRHDLSMFKNISFNRANQRHHKGYIQLKPETTPAPSPFHDPDIIYELMPPDAQNIQLVKPYTIYPYQLELVYWLYQRELNPLAVPYFTPGVSGGIIAMLMGLGKTLVIAYLTMLTLKEQRSLQCPTLYVCPANLVGTVHREFKKFFGHQLNVAIYHPGYWEGQSFRLLTSKDIQQFDVIIISYAMLSNHMKNPACILTPQLWYRTILDESHDIRNDKTLNFRSVMRLQCSRRICMTGTPIHNHLRDVYHQLLFCGFILPDDIKVSKHISVPFFQQYLAPHLVLRDYSCLDASLLPTKHEHIVIIPLHPMEAQLHSQIMKTHEFNVQQLHTTYGKVHQTYVERLKQTVDAELSFCVAAHLIHRDDDHTSNDTSQDRTLIGLSPIQFSFEFNSWLADVNGEAGIKSSKLTALVSIITSIRAANEKCIIFGNKVKPLQLAIKALPNEFQDKYRFIYGEVPPDRREPYYSQFRTDPNVFMLFSTLALGNRGLNLTEANHVIFIQPWYCWSPMEQGIYRTYRIGQTRPVHYYVLLSQGTSDERIFQKVKTLAASSKEALDVTTMFD